LSSLSFTNFKRNVERINEIAIEKAKVDQELPEPKPGALLGYDNDVLLAGLRRSILFSLASVIKSSSVLTVCIKAIHVFLLHLVFIVKERDQEVGFLPHLLDMVAQLSPVGSRVGRLLSGQLTVLLWVHVVVSRVLLDPIFTHGLV
jgi:ABC-type microcin C transport system permease subunit YejE